MGQIKALLYKNRANDDTSIKFGTLVLQVILIKSTRSAKWKFKMAAIFQDGRQISRPKLTSDLEVFVVVRFALSKYGFLYIQGFWNGFSYL